MTPADGCYGITWGLALVNNVVLDLSEFDAGTYTLDSYTLANLASGCIGDAVSTTTTSAASTTAVVVATPTAVTMEYFIYGDSDQTSLAKAKFVNGNDITISLEELEEDFTNSWAGTSKASDERSIIMLFEFGTDLRVFVSAMYASDDYSIVPGALSLSPYTYEATTYTKPAAAEITIVSIVWGIGVITNETVYDAVYSAATAGESFEFSNVFFGEDTWSGYVKTGVIFYRDSSGNLQHLTGDENSYQAFPTSATKKRGFDVSDLTTKRAYGTAISRSNTIPVRVPQKEKRSPAGNSGPYGRHFLSSRSDNTTMVSNSTTADDTTGVVTIVDTTGTLYLNSSINGSLFVSIVSDSTNLTSLTDGIQFAADLTEGLVIGDSASRLLYYFPDSMTSVGASRLRLGAWGEIPLTANLINLVPMSTGTEEILVAIDTLGNYYFPFVCGIQDQLNKVFLAQDPATGASVLESSDLIYTVVGGVASNCAPLALVAEGL